MTKNDCIGPLTRAGIAYEDAVALRRISMTLHRWHELECGDSNDYASWTVTRGHKNGGEFVHDEDGKPYLEWHPNNGQKTSYTRVPDREAGAKKRLAVILGNYWAVWCLASVEEGGSARVRATSRLFTSQDEAKGYASTVAASRQPEVRPAFTAYIQGDPRGAALYILRPGDVPEGEDPSAYYSRGLAVYK